MWKYARYFLVVFLAARLFSTAPLVKAGLTTLSETISPSATVPGLSETSDSEAPSIPILVRPEDGTVTGDNRPEFVWKDSVDSGSNTISYDLYLNGVATYLGISNLGNSSGLGYTARLDAGETKLQVTIPIRDGVYNWYVTARDSSGNQSTSTTWNLTIDTVPPTLSIIDIDTYHNPVIQEGSNFDIDGPKDVYFTASSDPYATIQISLSSQDSDIYHLESHTDSNGLAYLYQHLTPGLYTATVLAFDQAHNITVHPSFTLTIHESIISIKLPGRATPLVTFPYTPISLPPSSLPATVSYIASRGILPVFIAALLAAIIVILLIILGKRRYNLIVIDGSSRPLPAITIYHSIPDTISKSTRVFLSRHDPLSYRLPSTSRGRIYLPHLTRYSTLTIVTPHTTYLLSLSTTSRIYTITLS